MQKKHVSHPSVAALLNQNPVFRSYPVEASDRKVRDRLPVLSDRPANSMIWMILKENVGKDLSKITLPVRFNEPISMLQKCAEYVEYQELLRMANKTENRFLRIGYVIGAFYILYSNTINRISKPFNPMLGETFEYFDNDLRMVVEQVSHHPPVSAFFAESNDFIIEGWLIRFALFEDEAVVDQL